MEWRILAASGLLAALGSFWWAFRYKHRLKRHAKEEALFYAMLGHELKTPLNGIIGFAELLQYGDANAEEQKQYARDIGLSAHILLTLINNMLDCAKLNAGQIQIQPRPTRLDDLAAELPLLLNPLLLEKNLRLKIELPDNLPLLRIDPERVRQILLNLIGNAIKFSKDGVIAIQAGWTPSENHRGRLTLKVSDQGQGIPPEYQKIIFEPFVQQRQHSAAGTGLGLFISMQLVKRMNGSIELESEVGKGSCFTITLPETVYD